MKNIIGLLVILLCISAEAYSQNISNVSISGDYISFKTLTVNADVDEGAWTGARTEYLWEELSTDGTVVVDTIDHTAASLLISDTLVNQRIRALVFLISSDDADTLKEASSISPVIIANSLPVASNVSIAAVSGNMNVGSTLLGQYDYSDADNDPEGESVYEWLRGDSPASATSVISGADERSFNIRMIDTGMYFNFRVTPISSEGDPDPGTTVTSASATPKVNNAPYIDNVSLPANVSATDDIQVTYTFHDPDPGDGDACTFRWFKDGVEFINQSDTYTTVAEDQGSDFYVIITPVSDNGYPDTGDDVTSGTCSVTVSAVPEATGVCIKGDREAGARLEGHFTYVENGTGDEGTSLGEWLVNGTVVQTGDAKSNKWWMNKYTLNGDTVNIEDIVFRVTPKRNSSVVGLAVSSARLAKISNTKTNFSIIDDPVALNALPEAGVFSSEDGGVSGSAGSYTFDPSDTADFDINLPVVIKHRLETASGGCVQQDSITFYVSAATTYFTNDQDVYCNTTTSSDIDVEGLPADYIGNGIFDIKYSDGWLRPSSFMQVSDQKVRIYPPQIPPRTRPGGPAARLSYRYSTLAGIWYEIVKDIYVDSIGVYLAITNVNNSYCENDDTVNIGVKEFYPTNGVGTWDWATTDILRNEDNFGATLDPALKSGGGTETISYTYTLPSGCSRQVSAPVTIHPAPRLDFSIVDGCIEHDKDTTRFINSSPDAGLVQRWLWEFGEIFPSISEDFQPGFMYKTEGERDVTLIGTTLYGCSDTLIKEIGLGVKPEGDFYWEDDCFNPAQDLKLFDDTKPTSTIESTLWDINHSGGQTLIPDELNPTFTKTQPEIISVDYYLFTAYPGCQDTVSKEIYIRPMHFLADSVYAEDFEGTGLGWVKDASVLSTWEHDIPNYHTSQPDGKAWYTDTLSGDLVEYSVESLCFDFTGVERPMIKLDILSIFDEGRDGAVLQYKEGNAAVWENIGGTDFGIKWYNNSNISGRPGGSVVGWSPETKNTSFVQARQYLDELAGMQDVKLRISYGSDGNAQDSRGFAFDNVWIGERSRKVLVEHFTNYNSTEVVDADIELNSIIEDAGDDAMNIQYHTNYRADDQLYLDNTAVPSARMLFYSLVRNPFTIFDGGTGTNYATKYDWGQEITEANINDLRNRSLTDPLFAMKIDTLPNYRFNVSVEPLQDINVSNMTLYLAVVANEITGLTGSNGQTEFRNVLRKMVPDAGGISLKKDWTATEGQKSYGPYSRNISEDILHEADSVELIAFLQNNITKEVYQAASSGSLPADISTSIGRVGFDEATFKIFPNPAGSNLTLLFDRQTSGNSRIVFYNNAGVLIKEYDLPRGVERYKIEDLGLPDGMYLVKLIIDRVPQGYSKLVVTRR